MNIIFKKQKFLIFSLLIFLSGVSLNSYFEYFHARDSGLDAIDEQLLITAGFSQEILHDYIHKHADGPAVPIEDEYELALKLQHLADRMKVSYIYSLIKDDGKIKFMVSNPEESGKSISKYKRMYMLEYIEAPEAAFAAFANGKVKYGEYHDRWGDFRSVFFPFIRDDEKLYVIGVDVEIGQVLANSRKSGYTALISGLCLAMLIIPLMYSYIRTFRRHYHEKIKLAHSHPITGLPNKRSMDFNLDLAEENKLILIEIENLETITNVFGVDATDGLILNFASHLQELKIESLLQCRFFHLEDNLFAILGDETLTRESVEDITSTAHEVLSKPILSHRDESMPLLLRMASVFNQPNSFVLAKMTLSHAKFTNQSFVMYKEELDLPAHFKKYIQTLNLLVDALAYERIRLYYQPIFHPQTDRVVKYEALARIVDADDNVICLPNQFMPIAYQSRLCNELTRVVLDEVIETLKVNDRVVSINLSVKDLFDEQTRKYIIRRLKQAKAGRHIEFELLERQIICNYRLAAEYIEELRDHCRAVGMDDMGKYYSNFDRLLRLPLDFVKIDGMVIESMDRDKDAEILVDGIVQFARKKHIKVVAECCETEAIYKMLTAMGIDLIQGFYLGKPNTIFLDVSKQEPVSS